jgi:hypothetical protein
MKALFLGILLKRKRAKKALFLIYVVKWDMVRARKGHLACKEPKRSSGRHQQAPATRRTWGGQKIDLSKIYVFVFSAFVGDGAA